MIAASTTSCTRPEALIDTTDAALTAALANNNDKFSTSVGKALALLCVFTSGQAELGVSELARAAGLPKSTAFRLLAILVSWGILERSGTRYSLGQRVNELAATLPNSRLSRIRDLALPYLQDLYEITHETVHLATPVDSDVFYIEKIHGHNQVKSPSRVGGKLNAGCCALGKAMLAFSDVATVLQVFQTLRPRTQRTIMVPDVMITELRKIRESRVAFDYEEAAIGVTCVASPILNSTGKAVAAVSVCGPIDRFDPIPKSRAVRNAALGIERALGPASF